MLFCAVYKYSYLLTYLLTTTLTVGWRRSVQWSAEAVLAAAAQSPASAASTVCRGRVERVYLVDSFNQLDCHPSSLLTALIRPQSASTKARRHPHAACIGVSNSIIVDTRVFYTWNFGFATLVAWCSLYVPKITHFYGLFQKMKRHIWSTLYNTAVWQRKTIITLRFCMLKLSIMTPMKRLSVKNEPKIINTTKYMYI